MTDSAEPDGELDAQELMFLALRAMEQDRDDDAIRMLKQALLLEPESGILHHLLGAMYAQIGMIDRAVEEMTQACAYNPQLDMARFQLGMLHFTSANIDAATAAWAPLLERPEDDPLWLFVSGLERLARDEFEVSIDLLSRGLERNTEHPSLNSDMQMVREMAQQALAERRAGGTAGSAAAAASADAPADAGKHVLLSGYQGLSGKQ